MNAPDRPKLNVDDLLRRVRDEVAHRRGEAGAPSGVSAFSPSRDPGGDEAYSLLPDLELEPRFETNSSGYAIEDFTRLQHAAFLKAAYRGLLRREPDPPGLHHFLQRLERGDSKHLILGLIRYSPEGRRHAIPVRGLRWRFVVERGCEVPIAGRFVRFLVDLARLPALMREARQNESRIAGQLAAVNEHAAAANRATYGMAAAFSHEQREAIDRLDRVLEQQALAAARMASWKTSADERLAASADEAARMASWKTSADERLAASADEAARMALWKTNADERLAASADEAARMASWKTSADERLAAGADEAARMASWKTSADERLAAGAAAHEFVARAAQALETGLGDLTARVKHMEDQADDQKRAGDAFAQAFDEVYAAFEEKFRGESDDVKGRLAVYVPRLVDAGLGTSEAPALDLGCGRGEWLELLKDRGLRARGVDTNRTMLARCQALGLDVTEADALASLTETPAASLGVVTGFHIVEHLPLPYLVSMLKETARTLRPGGIAIFETPNPENVLVGSHTFYLDPTHLNPIPPATLTFFMEAAGLRDVEVVFLHPAPAYERLATSDPAVDAFFNSRFFGPRDYAVIAHKA